METKHSASADRSRPIPRPRVGVALHLIASPDNLEVSTELEQVVDLAVRDTTLDFVELSPIGDPSLRARLAEQLRLAGIEVVFNTGPVVWRDELDFGTADAEQRATSLRLATDAVEQAREFGASLVQISPGPDHPRDREGALERTAEAMHELCAVADGMSLACELYDRDHFSRRLLGPIDEAAAFVASVDRPNFGLLLDTSHLMLQGEDPAEAAASLCDAVLHVHLANCVTDRETDGAGDEHPYFGAPAGTVDAEVARNFIGALARHGYFADPARGRIGAEVKRAASEDPVALLFNSCRFVRQAADYVVALDPATHAVAP